jgi:hypothetical protein
VPYSVILASNVPQKSKSRASWIHSSPSRVACCHSQEMRAHRLIPSFLYVDVLCRARSTLGIATTETGMVLCVGGELVSLDPGKSDLSSNVLFYLAALSRMCVTSITAILSHVSFFSSCLFPIDGGKKHFFVVSTSLLYECPRICLSPWYRFLRFRYLRIVDSEGKTIVTGTKQITGRRQLEQVKAVMKEALEDLGLEVPNYL